MKAKLVVALVGESNRSPGDEVTGDEAVRLCAAGFATPIVETEKREKAVTKKVEKETR